MSAPTQHMQALDLANEIRLEGARIRRVMASHPMDESRRLAAQLLRDPPPAIARMRVGHFLSGITRFGQHKAIQFMLRAEIRGAAWDRRVGPLFGGYDPARKVLTARQREALAVVLEEGL